jgi:hypothetical protein
MCGEAYEIKEFALTGHLDGGLAHHLGSHTWEAPRKDSPSKWVARK